MSRELAILVTFPWLCRTHKYKRRTQQFRDSFLEEFAAIDEPIPALTNLDLISLGQDVPVLPDSFLGGSAPRLRSLDLAGIPFPSIGNLLSSTTNLVRLCLWDIPHSGCISPEEIVPCLSTLARLKRLSLGFRSPRPQALRASRHPLRLTRIVFPSLTTLGFRGDIEYLEDILSQIGTPILKETDFILFNQLVFDTQLLGRFIHRTETFMTFDTARVEFSSYTVGVSLFRQEELDNDDWEELEDLQLEIRCKVLDWQLSGVSQVLNTLLSSLPTFYRLAIGVYHGDWQDEVEDIQWQELLYPFSSVKTMMLESEDSARLVAPALQKLTEERATEVLPALQNISLMTRDWRPSGSVKEAIEQFIATRQLYSQPVIVHYQDTESEED